MISTGSVPKVQLPSTWAPSVMGVPVMLGGCAQTVTPPRNGSEGQGAVGTPGRAFKAGCNPIHRGSNFYELDELEHCYGYTPSS